jgi:hypothetical protein
LSLLVEYLQRLAPGCLLAIVDFAQIENSPLHYAAGLQTPALLDAVIAVFFAVFHPAVASQEHAHQQECQNFLRLQRG